MYGRSWWRLGGLVLLVGFAIRLDAQTPASGPAELFVTRLQGATTGTTTSQQATPERPAGLPPLPVTGLDDRLLAADLDGPRRVSLTISRPMPLRDLLLLLVNGTPLSLVNDEAVDGNFVGDLKDLTMRQALEAVLFPRGLDYDVQGTLIRVFPHRASTRLFDVNYLNVRRTWQRGIRSSASVGGQVPAAGLSASSESDLFDELAKGVQALLSASGRLHVDRVAGLVQVTDFSDRLDQVGVYVEAVQLRAMRQVRIVAHVFDVSFREWSAAAAIDWKAVAVRTGAGTRSSDGHGAAGLTVADIEVLKQAIAEQGTVTMLAAPQVVAMNNEPAVMRVGTETVYFESASSVAQDDARQRTTKPGAVLEGLTLTVTAQISADGLVLLNVSPTYASRAGQSKSVDGETFPVLRISEADMMVRVRDGETIVLSGFLENRETRKPATGMAAMFGAHPRTTVKSELVILLTPSIVSPGVPATAAAK